MSNMENHQNTLIEYLPEYPSVSKIYQYPIGRPFKTWRLLFDNKRDIPRNTQQIQGISVFIPMLYILQNYGTDLCGIYFKGMNLFLFSNCSKIILREECLMGSRFRQTFAHPEACIIFNSSINLIRKHFQINIPYL